MTVPDDLSALEKKPFADAVVKFEELLAQGGRAFLIGAGCSKCAGLPLTTQLTENVLSSSALDTTTKDIFSAIRDLFAGAGDPNMGAALFRRRSREGPWGSATGMARAT